MTLHRRRQQAAAAAAAEAEAETAAHIAQAAARKEFDFAQAATYFGISTIKLFLLHVGCKRRVVFRRCYVRITKEKRINLTFCLAGFCLFDSGAVWYLLHLSPDFPRSIMPSFRLLNQINKICETEL